MDKVDNCVVFLNKNSNEPGRQVNPRKILREFFFCWKIPHPTIHIKIWPCSEAVLGFERAYGGFDDELC